MRFLRSPGFHRSFDFCIFLSRQMAQCRRVSGVHGSLLLGRGDGGAIHRLVCAFEGPAKSSVRIRRGCRLRSGLDFDPQLRTYGYLEHLARRTFNSIMFPTIFTLGIAELGPLTGTGSGIMVGGYCRWRDSSPLRRETGGLDRYPPRVHHSGGLLYLSGLLRIQRIAAYADCQGLGSRRCSF